MERCHFFDDVAEDVYLNASIGTMGVAMLRKEQDELSGEFKLDWDVVDLNRFYPEPGPTRLYKCQYVIYEQELPLSRIKELWPDKGGLIQPKKSQPVGKTLTGNTVQRSTEEIIQAPGRDYVISGQGDIRERVADVAFMWAKDNSVISDVITNVLKEPTVGAECLDCGQKMAEPMDQCPSCGSPNMQPVDIPAETDSSTVYSRPYPYGRLTITCQDTLLYDGENDLQLDAVFPFSIYGHYRVPNRLHGYGDVSLLKSSQMQMDKNMAQLIDAMRITLTGYLQVPANEPAWQHVTNEPGQKVPTRIENAAIARWVTPQGYNAQLHSIGDDMMYRDIQRISGQTDTSVNQTPTAPDSATEVKSRDLVKNQRVGRHLKKFTRFLSDSAQMHWQAMNQLYVGPRPFSVQSPDRTFNAIMADVSMLPRDLTMRVEADIDQTERDKNIGQNIPIFIEKVGMDNPFAPFFLRMIGANDAEIRELMEIQKSIPPQPPAPPPVAGDKVLVAMSDILKVQPTFIAFEQVQAALMMVNIPPAPEPQMQNKALAMPPPTPDAKKDKSGGEKK